MTRRRRSPRPVSLALTAASERWEPETVLAEIQRVWRQTVGDAISAEASPASERRGVVTVSCSASVWAHELDLMGPDIVERVNAVLQSGQIQRLRCVTVPVPDGA